MVLTTQNTNKEVYDAERGEKSGEKPKFATISKCGIIYFMTNEKPQIEFWYGLGCEPVLIGAGSFDDFDQANREAEALDAVSKAAPGAVMSAGTRHILRENLAV